MNACELPNECGVYFLYSGDQCVYVGSSIAIRNRVNGHNHRGNFDRVTFILCDVERLNELEQEYIERLDPPLNRMHTVNHNRKALSGGKVIAAYVPSELANAIKTLAAQEKRTLANMIYVLLCEAIEARQEYK